MIDHGLARGCCELLFGSSPLRSWLRRGARLRRGGPACQAVLGEFSLFEGAPRRLERRRCACTDGLGELACLAFEVRPRHRRGPVDAAPRSTGASRSGGSARERASEHCYDRDRGVPCRRERRPCLSPLRRTGAHRARARRRQRLRSLPGAAQGPMHDLRRGGDPGHPPRSGGGHLGSPDQALAAVDKSRARLPSSPRSAPQQACARARGRIALVSGREVLVGWRRP